MSGESRLEVRTDSQDRRAAGRPGEENRVKRVCSLARCQPAQQSAKEQGLRRVSCAFYKWS